MKQKIYHYSKLLLLVAVFISAYSQNGHAQNSDSRQPVSITGKVTDTKSKEGIVGATVAIKGTTTGVLTDVNGNFDFKTSQKPPFTVVVSYLGYRRQEVEVFEIEPLTFALSEIKGLKLDEVVVIGYSTQERKNLVGSVTKIDPGDVKNIPVASVDAQLQGKAAGVQINANTGIPGEAISVRVRGTTSINGSNAPLYIVDGVFINATSLQTINMGGTSTSPLADINPSDIESIEVLKDANATAIYGSRGANGVVIITTKRGEYNTKAKINLNVTQGFSEIQKSRLWKLVTGPESAAFVNEAWINAGIDNPALKQTFANRPYRPKSEGGRGLPEEQGTFDRLSDVFRVASLKEYDLSLQGGTKTTKYYIGGNYTKQEATVRPVYFERSSFKLNLDQQVNDQITIGTSNSISRSYRNQLISGSTPRGIFQSALLTATNLPKYNDDGTPALWGGFDNVDVLVNNNFINTVSLRYIGNLYADIDLLPNLKFRTSWSVDYNNYDENEYWTDETVVGAAPTNGRARSSLTQNSAWVNEQTLSYRKKFDKHSFSALVGNTLQSNILKNTAAEGSNFPNNSYQIISSASIFNASQSWTKGSLASFFSRVDYNYNSKYLFEFTFRADGSSRFGGNNKWGYFPSVGGAWRVKEEDFLKNVSFISDLKLRASVGVTGNQSGIGDFASLGLWNGGPGYPDNESSGVRPGTSPQQLANPDLVWEKTRQANIGLEAGFLDNRINVELNFYDKYTTDVLLQLPLPGTSGFTSYASNVGKISNKGFELSINTFNIQRDRFKWQTNLNVATNVNKIVELPNPINSGFITLEQGYPMFSFQVYKQLYVDAQTGNAVYEDVNKDGQITVADRQILGTFTPKFFGGLTNALSYKDFDLNVLFTFQQGNYLFNENRNYGESGGTRADRSYHLTQANRWQKPGDITDIPRITTVGTNYNLSPNSRYLEDASFIRLKNLSLGYTIPVQTTSKLKISKARLFVNGSNLWLLTKYTGPDPEAYVPSSGNQNAVGRDFCIPPQPQSVQFGINLTF
ncbi:TonB-dependent receptor [Emticicia sp. BO119]|uniref:SusC/RagA family TonB-linked outer membrane protein n=1 Tax=Emticicia sp. BO119 TaxID=2757768 RepID=UPI0015EFE8B7|nr:TonB-dependent receptor [Emticicia sp. BO119]MBA4850569.1 TonB-dependent receptor [Emticicia sp. BO119]